MKDLFHNRIIMRGGIVLAILLLYLMSGGFPPTTWVALFQAASSADALGAVSRLDLLSAPFILGAQSLFLMVAWAVLLCLAANEMASVVLSGQTGGNIFPTARHEAGVVQDKHAAPTVPAQEAVTIPIRVAHQQAALPASPMPSLSLHNALTAPIFAKEIPSDMFLPPSLPTQIAVSQGMENGHKKTNEMQQQGELSPERPPLTAIGGKRAHTSIGRAKSDTAVVEAKFAHTVVEARHDSARTVHPPVLSTSIQHAPRVHAVTHTGLVRAHKPNEDSYLQIDVTRHSSHKPPQWAGLFLVADGMGGYTHGQYASSLVVRLICQDLEPALRDPQCTVDELKERFIQAVQHANRQLFQENQAAGVFSGTTVTGVIMLEETGKDSVTKTPTTYVAHVINVGDSRTYWHSAEGFSRVTRDHSTVEELIALKVITPEERYTHIRRNEIYRCLGDKEDIEVDAFTITLQPRDRLLLCTDGLWEMVRDNDLGWLLAMSTDDPSQITELLLKTALTQGGHDNVTALVVMVPGYQGG